MENYQKTPEQLKGEEVLNLLNTLSMEKQIKFIEKLFPPETIKEWGVNYAKENGYLDKSTDLALTRLKEIAEEE